MGPIVNKETDFEGRRYITFTLQYRVIAVGHSGNALIPYEAQ